MTRSESGVHASLEALNTTRVLLRGVRPAGEVMAAVGERRFLHSGPPLACDEVPGPMEGAVIAGLLFEREAADVEAARAIAATGDVELSPCHDAGAVGAMAGIVTPSMPVVVAESEDGSRRACSPLNEGLGRALRFGSYDESTIRRLRWMTDVAGPSLDRAIGASKPIDLVELVAEGLRRGDECHNRNVATSAALIAHLAPALVREAGSATDSADVLAYAAGNRHFALPFSIGMAKVLADAAHDVAAGPLVTAISGNGVRVGIRVSATGSRWFTAPAPLGEARFFDGYDASVAQPLMGDSMIAETVGFGAFALSAAPAIVSFIGGTIDKAREVVEDMRTICAGTSRRFLIPGDGFRGAPIGVDVHQVAATGVAPVIDNGISHREAGVGQVGAGLTRLPLDPFLEASDALRGGRYAEGVEP